MEIELGEGGPSRKGKKAQKGSFSHSRLQRPQAQPATPFGRQQAKTCTAARLRVCQTGNQTPQGVVCPCVAFGSARREIGYDDRMDDAAHCRFLGPRTCRYHVQEDGRGHLQQRLSRHTLLNLATSVLFLCAWHCTLESNRAGHLSAAGRRPESRVKTDLRKIG